MHVLLKCILMLRRIKKLLTAVILTICSLISSSCTNNEPVPVKYSDYLLGTLVSITVYDDIPDIDGIVGECFNIVRRFESKVSVNIATSELSVLNSKAFYEAVELSDTLYDVISRSIYFCELTDGAFDIGLGKLIELWGIGTDKQRIPSETEISPYIGFKAYEHILLDNENKTVKFTDERVSINLGACAKGYVEDMVRDYLTDAGVESALLDFGGSITAIGNKNGEGFRVAIANPDNEYSYSCILKLSDFSSVTSGDYQRYFESDGKRYHHILDSTTGFPSVSGISGVTIVTESAFEGDCLSTASFVLGKDKAADFLDKFGCGYVIISDGDMTFSSLLEGMYEK